MTRIALAGVLFVFMSACVAGDEEDFGSIESEVNVLPVGGGWTYGSIAPLFTTCSASVPINQDGPFIVDTVTTSSFRVIPNDGTAPFTCTSSDSQFSCPNRARAVVDLRPFIDIRVTVQVIATGAFSDTRHATGKQNAAVSCVGTQCSLLGTMPCGFQANFAVHHQSVSS